MAVGINPGNTAYKLVSIDTKGREAEAHVIPSIVAPASDALFGSIQDAVRVSYEDGNYWAGADAAELGGRAAISVMGDARLSDAVFVPVMVRAVLNNAGYNGKLPGAVVSGLPAVQALDEARAKQLGALIRKAVSVQKVRILPEPLALIYAVLLDENGNVADDTYGHSAASVDIGGGTVDVASVNRLRTIRESLHTWEIGVVYALERIRARLQNDLGRELSVYETDQAVRAGGIRHRNIFVPLPNGWDAPLIETGRQIAARLNGVWGNGGQFDAIVIGGGGAHLPQLTEPTLQAYPHAVVAPDPQMAIARGYAKFGRRLETAEGE